MEQRYLSDYAAFFVLREIEVSLAKANDVTLDFSRRLVIPRLPVSKTDPQALGCTRAWGCVCDGNRSEPCLFCSTVAQFQFLQATFSVNGELPQDLPLFPTA